MITYLISFFIHWFSSSLAFLFAHAVVAVGLSVLCYGIDFVARQYLLRAIRYFTQKTKVTWDDKLVQARFFDRLAHIAPVLFVYMVAPVVYSDFPLIVAFFSVVTQVVIVFVSLLAADSVLVMLGTQIQQSEWGKKVAVGSTLQVVRLIIYFLGGIFLLSILLGKSPMVFLSGLGALTAVLLLVFKDTILGFVAGLQLSANEMVAIGDWIEMPDFGADGDVLEVGLTSVKVQNWDKTISTIPTHALVSHSFKNWRGMSESGGRRIKRFISIDMATVKFCDDAMIAKCKQLHLLKDYVEQKERDIDLYNKTHNIDASHLANGRRMTNLGMFRAYIQAYLYQHPLLNRSMTLLVRHLQPTEKGIPIEIYAFSRDQAWVNYEGIQADILDHILAVLPEFELSVFQLPSGHDVKSLKML